MEYLEDESDVADAKNAIKEVKKHGAKPLKQLAKILELMYSIEISTSAEKRIFKLTEEPIPPGAKKLKGVESLYRVPQGDWRIVYTVENKRLSVLVVKVGHRREAYR